MTGWIVALALYLLGVGGWYYELASVAEPDDRPLLLACGWPLYVLFDVVGHIRGRLP